APARLFSTHVVALSADPVNTTSEKSEFTRLASDKSDSVNFVFSKRLSAIMARRRRERSKALPANSQSLRVAADKLHWTKRPLDKSDCAMNASVRSQSWK